MPSSSSPSFIPKRNPTQNDGRITVRKVYIGTIIVRVIFFAALLGAVGVYFYEKKLESNLDEEVVILNTAVATFNEAELQRVLSTDHRLSQVNYRLDHTTSISALLTAIEESTIQPAQITNFSLERVSDDLVEIESDIKTANFDLVLFQRNIMKENNILAVEDLTDITLVNPPPDNGLFVDRIDENQEAEGVSFTAVLTVDTSMIPHQPNELPPAFTETLPTSVESPSSTSTATSTNESDVNQVEI